MSVRDGEADERTEPAVNEALKLRSATDRTCPTCGEVALAYDVDAGRARCRACGTLD